MKLAQLCEDKGKACFGRKPSASIWVLSSLGPGGTWEHTSHGRQVGIYCPLMVWAVQWSRIHEAGLYHLSCQIEGFISQKSSNVQQDITDNQLYKLPNKPNSSETG